MKDPRIIIYPYKKASESGQAIAKALGATVLTAESDYKPKDGDIVINWGNGNTPLWSHDLADADVTLLNHWDDVDKSINKIAAFYRLKKGCVPTPPFTEKMSKALEWAKGKQWVCCRQKTEGMDGAGLVLAKSPQEIVDAKLYTMYMPIAKEFRVYVFRDKVLDIREKRRDSDALAAGKVNEYIRTTSSNWVFCQNNIIKPKDIDDVAIAAVAALGLDWAGVDIIQAKENGKCYVLETNTAPYVGYNTISKLAQAIKSL